MKTFISNQNHIEQSAYKRKHKYISLVTYTLHSLGVWLPHSTPHQHAQKRKLYIYFYIECGFYINQKIIRRVAKRYAYMVLGYTAIVQNQQIFQQKRYVLCPNNVTHMNESEKKASLFRWMEKMQNERLCVNFVLFFVLFYC